MLRIKCERNYEQCNPIRNKTIDRHFILNIMLDNCDLFSQKIKIINGMNLVTYLSLNQVIASIVIRGNLSRQNLDLVLVKHKAYVGEEAALLEGAHT